MNIEEVWPEWHESELIGEGSFGKVYKATREEFGETFFSAIKVLSVPKSDRDIRQERAQGMSDLEIHAYFQSIVQDLANEIVLMESLKGAANIVSIDDYRIIERTGEIGWDIFIRMELMRPFDEVANSPDFSVTDVLKMGVDICSALVVCEYNKIVHRDIKPDNIFVSRYGEYKLGDFGISRQLDKTQANMSRKGTLNFMAPEVYKGESYGSSVDIYSLGLVMYKLLNKNRLPFIESEQQNLKYNERQEAFERRIRGEKLPLIPGVNNNINYILQKACAFNPEERYASASEFKNDLIGELNNILYYGTNEMTINNQCGLAESYDSYNNTTNDMTSHGQVMYDENVSENSLYIDSDESAYGNFVANQKSLDNKKRSLHKTSKICRYIAIPIAVAAFVILLIDHAISTNIFEAVAVLSILFIGRNRRTVGIAIAANAVFNIIGCFTYGEMPEIEIIVLSVSGFLCFLGGVSMILQKEVRLGGVLILYGGLISVIYRFIESDISSSLFGVMAFSLSVLFWAYGYDSNWLHDTTVKKIGYIFSYILVAAGAVIKAIELLR